MIDRQSRQCPSGPELERAFFEGSEEFANHLTECEACRSGWDEISSLATLASELEGPTVDHNRLEDVRTEMLARLDGQPASPPRPSRWISPRRVAIGGSVVLAAAAALLVIPRLQAGPATTTSAKVPTPAETFRGDIRADDPLAHFDRVSAQPRELVRLHGGTISVAVETLEPGESFVVVTDDAEVEVRGTRFSVSATDGRLVGVLVHEGRVVVRSAGSERTLATGEHWEIIAATESQPDPETEEPARVALDGAHLIEQDEQKRENPGKRKVQAVAREEITPPTPSAFELGWKHLRDKRYLEAAADFERATKAAETRASRADAIYWASISHYRAGKRERARVLLRKFRSDHATDRRGPEVATMLGWIEVDRGALDIAKRLFEIGARSKVAKVRKSAEAGLATLEKANAGRR